MSSSPPTENLTFPRPPFHQTLIGAGIAGVLAFLAFLFYGAISAKLPIPVLTIESTLADKLSALVRTLVISLTVGAVFIFATIALGLALLSLKSIVEGIMTTYFSQVKPKD